MQRWCVALVWCGAGLGVLPVALALAAKAKTLHSGTFCVAGMGEGALDVR